MLDLLITNNAKKENSNKLLSKLNKLRVIYKVNTVIA